MILHFRGDFIQHYRGDCLMYTVSKLYRLCNQPVKLVTYFVIWGDVGIEMSKSH